MKSIKKSVLPALQIDEEILKNIFKKSVIKSTVNMPNKVYC